MPRVYSAESPETSEPEGKPTYATEIEYAECEETTPPPFREARSAGSVVMSPEIPTIPVGAVAGLRNVIGNPTPIAITGFVMSLTPLSCDLMGWRGAGGNGAAHIGAYIFFGGILLLVGGFMECLIGNTFASVVFMSFGCFYLTLATTLTPFYGAYAAYSPSPSDPAAGLATEGFNASFGFFLVFFNVLCFFYLICCFRTNVVLVYILFTVVLGVGLIIACYFYMAMQETAMALKFQVGGGAVLFAACLGGWYLLFALLLVAVDFPLQLPLGDLTNIVPSYTQLQKESDLERC